MYSRSYSQSFLRHCPNSSRPVWKSANILRLGKLYLLSQFPKKDVIQYSFPVTVSSNQPPLNCKQNLRRDQQDSRYSSSISWVSVRSTVRTYVFRHFHSTDDLLIWQSTDKQYKTNSIALDICVDLWFNPTV